MQALVPLLKKSSMHHRHLCPRQILGVRIGLAGMSALGFTEAPLKKRLLVISEMDGCFVDGIIAATGCTVGHRTLRVEDYGKVAATFIDTQRERAVRVSPVPGLRERACIYAPHESRPYFAQMQAYQMMPVNEMLNVQEVTLINSVKWIISRPGIRVDCDVCGEEITNQREIHCAGLTLCHACAGNGYYQTAIAHISLHTASA
jgi:formylmethanofuran dehydrogenase subunit E